MEGTCNTLDFFKKDLAGNREINDRVLETGRNELSLIMKLLVLSFDARKERLSLTY